MCGIVSLCDHTKSLTIEQLKKMTARVHHRGPDYQNCIINKFNDFYLGLGHARLSILDLSAAANQPMVYDNLSIVYNGEIYNFKEIQKILIEKGYNFETSSDTEVLLKGFHCFGTKIVDQLIGMFAFTIFDQKTNKMYVFRDRAGVKPLYYYQTANCFACVSELKSLKEMESFDNTLNYHALGLFFKFGYIPAPSSIYKNVQKLLPGHFMVFDIKTKTLKIDKYWEPDNFYRKEKLDISFSEAVSTTEKLLADAFNYRLVSDVPVGVFLSSGYDSTAVTALLQSQCKTPLKTFTIGFDDPKYNEAVNAKKIAKHLGTEHHELYCTEKEMLEVLDDFPIIFDEPFGDSSAIPTILLSKFARQEVTVALSADGGDEIFGGYPIYHAVPNLIAKRNLFPKWSWGLFHKFFRLLNNDLTESIAVKSFNFKNWKNKLYKLSEQFFRQNDTTWLHDYFWYFWNTEINNLIISKINADELKFPAWSTDHQGLSNLDAMMCLNYKTYLPDDIMTKVDRATMRYSLEAREPFLDHRIIEFAAQLPDSFKADEKNTKILLKNIVSKHVPKHLMSAKKQGFSIPLSSWYSGKLKSLFNHYLSEQNIKKTGVLNESFVKKLLQRYEMGDNMLIHQIWLIFVFQHWADFNL